MKKEILFLVLFFYFLVNFNLFASDDLGDVFPNVLFRSLFYEPKKRDPFSLPSVNALDVQEEVIEERDLSLEERLFEFSDAFNSRLEFRDEVLGWSFGLGEGSFLLSKLSGYVREGGFLFLGITSAEICPEISSWVELSKGKMKVEEVEGKGLRARVIAIKPFLLYVESPLKMEGKGDIIPLKIQNPLQ